MTDVLTGLDVLTCDSTTSCQGARLGLLMNQASLTSDFRYACDAIAGKFPGQLKRLYSPQHGFWGEQQANMVESEHCVYAPLGIPVESLYSATRTPNASGLTEIDILLIDLQDVGTRVYTFIWTMFECLKACQHANVQVVVLDRPNPIGGLAVEGPRIEPGFESFVGNAAIPMRHALTIGELALMLNSEHSIGCKLSVIPMRGWSRDMEWQDTRRPWVPPSPNMPSWTTAQVYPGQVLLEGTNVSEGRGTTRPFEQCGAPWLDVERLLQDLPTEATAGAKLVPIRFRPTFDKYRGELCNGVFVHVTDPTSFRSFRITVAMLNGIKHQSHSQFQWLAPPYEYEYHKPPIDILYGNDLLRRMLDQDSALDVCELSYAASADADAWWKRANPFLLYASAT